MKKAISSNNLIKSSETNDKIKPTQPTLRKVKSEPNLSTFKQKKQLVKFKQTNKKAKQIAVQIQSIQTLAGIFNSTNKLNLMLNIALFLYTFEDKKDEENFQKLMIFLILIDVIHGLLR